MNITRIDLVESFSNNKRLKFVFVGSTDENGFTPFLEFKELDLPTQREMMHKLICASDSVGDFYANPCSIEAPI